MLCTATSTAPPSSPPSSPDAPRRPSRAALANGVGGAIAATAVASALVATSPSATDDCRMEYQPSTRCSSSSTCSSSSSSGETVALSSSSVTTDDSLQHTQTNYVKSPSLLLRSAVVSIPHPDKAEKGGEDAFFVQSNALGVFDGVGGWASIGVDAGLYSKQLAQLTADHICKQGTCSVKEALKQAAATNQAIGSSTACVVGIHEHKLYGVNLGDSGLIVIRDGCVIYKTVEQQHYFNCPYQIGTDSLDTVDVANSIEVPLRHGDWIIMGTDGLWDNVFAENIVEVVVQHERQRRQQEQLEADGKEAERVNKSDSSSSDESSVVSDCGGLASSGRQGAEMIADKLGEVAVKIANNERSSSPFAVNARNAGHVFMGGKVDDITIISALVVDPSAVGASAKKTKNGKE
ncbi:PPM-type phosphatase [Gracilaria domingensis]|nr:PPM-type phosphatase [Gracilaria domingensis]